MEITNDGKPYLKRIPSAIPKHFEENANRLCTPGKQTSTGTPSRSISPEQEAWVEKGAPLGVQMFSKKSNLI